MSAPPGVAAECFELIEDFLPTSRAHTLFATLLHGLAWTQPTIALFGVRRPIPRLEAWYGDAEARYRYSGIGHEPLPWTAELTQLRLMLSQRARAPLNCVLANLYRDGNDSSGWHSDNERELGVEPTIASLSLGATRRFALRSHDEPRERIAFDLVDGSLLVMRGASQQLWQHSIPKEPKVMQSRINLTFRYVIAP